jgi:hypothetical protein
MPIPNEPLTDRSSGPVTSTQTPDELAKVIGLLRDQVDALQIKAAERETPWYRQPSMLFSIFALGISVWLTISGNRFQQEVRDATLKDARTALVRQNIMTLADLQMQLADAQQKNLNNPAITAELSANLNAKRQMLIEETESLIGKLGGDVTSAEYVNVGGELARDGRMAEAILYYDSALKKAPTPLAKSQASRSLAFAWMTAGANVNADSGRYYWKKALAFVNNHNDQYQLFLSVFHLQAWAVMESNLGNGARVDTLMKEAREKADLLIPGTPMRRQTDALLANPLQTDIPSVTTTAIKQ